MQEIVFADAVELVIARLNQRLTATGDAARARGEVPNPRPARFVLVRRTGGPKTPLHVTERAQLTVEAWDNDHYAAAQLAQFARAVVNAMEAERFGGIQVYEIAEFSGPADLPDPDSLQARFTWTLSMHLRAASVA